MYSLLSLILLATWCPETEVIYSSNSMVQFEVRYDTSMVATMIETGVHSTGLPVMAVTGGSAEVSWTVSGRPIRVADPCTLSARDSEDLVSIEGEGYFRNIHLTRVMIRPFQMLSGRPVFYPRVHVTLRWPRIRSVDPHGVEDFTESILDAVAVNKHQVPYLAFDPEESFDRATPPPSPSCRIIVEERGLYRVSADEFASAGVAISGEEISLFRLWYHGEEQRCRIEDDGDGIFRGDDAVIFYGETRHREDPEGRDDRYISHFSREAVYWLSWGGSETGLRWVEVDGTPGTGAPEAQWYRHLVHQEEENEVLIAFHNEAYNNSLEWFWQKLAASTVVRQFEIPTTEIVAADTFVLRVGIQGAADVPVHHSEFLINGTLVDTVWWGYGGGRDTLIYDSGERGRSLVTELLSEESTTIGIRELNDGPAGSSTKSYLNWIELRYPRGLATVDSALGFTGPAGSSDETYTFRLFGFPDDEAAVVNLSEGEWITGMTVSNDSLCFTADVSESDSLWAEYIPAMNSVTGIQSYTALDPALDDVSRSADYVVITDEAFSGPADTLAQAITTHFGWDTDVILVRNIYDYFSFGELHYRAIRDFLEASYDNWSESPSHVCILGDATWDFLGYSDVFTESNIVPTWGNPGNDFYYSRLTHDGQGMYDWIPDIAIGRLPARNLSDARKLVEKTILSLETDLYGKELLIMAHGSNDWENASFRAMSELLADYAIPSELLPSFSTVYGDSLGYQWERSYKEDFVQAWYNDPVLIHFIGRGDYYTWCMELHNTMTDTLAQTALPPFMIGGSCHSGRFALPDSNCLGERMLRSSDSRSGSSGIISSTGITSTSNVYIWASHALPLMFDIEPITVGEANVAGIIQAGDFISQRFILLSDPTLCIPRPRGADLGVRDEWFGTNPAEPEENDSNLHISLELANLGCSDVDGEDSCWVAVLDTTPTGTVEQIALIRTAIPSMGDIALSVPWIPSPQRGSHGLSIELDSEDEIDELDETNNHVYMIVDVSFIAPELHTPDDAASLVDQIVQLGIRSIPNEAGIRYRFQLSSDPFFAHPDSYFTESPLLPAGEFYTVWNPPSPPEETVLYWRCRGTAGDISGSWSDIRSFTVDHIADYGGWEQSHWSQFSTDSLYQCSIDTSLSRVTLNRQKGNDVALSDSGATIQTYSSSNPNFEPEAIIGEGAFIFGNNDSDQTIIIDLGRIRYLGEVGAEFWAGAMDRGVWSELEISTSIDGSTFLPWITYGPYGEPSLEIPARVFAEVDAGIYGRYIRGRFGLGCPQTSGVYWGSRIYEIYAFPAVLPPGGEVWSPAIGPALQWRSLSTEAYLPDVSDSIRVSVWGFSITGQVWETVTGFENLIAPGVWDLRTIDPEEYPWIRLQATFIPASEEGPALESWGVRFDPR